MLNTRLDPHAVRADASTFADAIPADAYGTTTDDRVIGSPRAAEDDADELAAALAEHPPRIPSKFFYDARGSVLFERICELPEYYPTRTELAIMREHVAEMAARLGPDVVLVEYGSGTSLKTRLLLAALERPRAYVPVDVSAAPLAAAAREIEAEFPSLVVEPLCADFTKPFAPPASLPRDGRRVAYFPGSTIGNFTSTEAHALLADMAELVGPGGAALIGADLRKDPAVLEAAYDDAAGVTAEFNLNLLRHVNRRYGLGLPPEEFLHDAPWCDEPGRIEMRLVAKHALHATFRGVRVDLAPGDYLLTEYSHKYRLGEFVDLARSAGWEPRRAWLDAREWFSVHLLER